MIQQIPRLAIVNNQLELMHRFAVELGPSPVSRTGVTVGPIDSTPWGLLAASSPACADPTQAFTDDDVSDQYEPQRCRSLRDACSIRSQIAIGVAVYVSRHVTDGRGSR